MDPTPIWIMFIHHFFAGLLMPWLGLLLINIKPRMKSLCICALVYATIAIIIRHFIGLPPNIGFIVQLIMLIISIMIIWNLGLFQSLIATILGALVMAVGEAFFLPLILQISGLSDQEIMNNTIQILFIPLPQWVMTLIVIFVCLKCNFHLFDFQGKNHNILPAYSKKRLQRIVIMVTTLFVVFILLLTLSVSVFTKNYGVFKNVHPQVIGTMVALAIAIVLMGMVFLILQLVELTQKENQYHMQSVYVDTLDELYAAIRSERHDIINHLQTIYGFTQLGYIEEVQNYLSELLGGNILSNEFIVTGTPGLTALFYIKSGIARTNEIKFKVNVEKQIDRLKLSPYELNNILGNMINNAFEAVMPQDVSQRIVNVFIGGDDDGYVFKVANYGYISDRDKKKIFEKGYSTKKGEHSGLGLYIIDRLVNKYGGCMEMQNTDNGMVEFSVLFPQKIEKGYMYESTSHENSAFVE